MIKKNKGFILKILLLSLLLSIFYMENVYGADIGISTQSATAIPSGYHFAPRYISSTTQVKLSDAPSGFKWVAVEGTGYYQLQTNAGKAKMPDQSYKGKISVVYKNVGTYFDRTIDMRITLTDWNSKAKRIEIGRTYLGFGNSSGDDGGTNAYITAKIEYLYSGTNTHVENMKGHQPVGDMDYWSDNNASEWIKTGNHASIQYIFDQNDYDKFDLSKVGSQMIGVKKGYGGKSNSDGVSFVYLFDNAIHTITWYGGFLRLNLQCPIKEFEVWYMGNGAEGELYSKVYKYGVIDKWEDNYYTRQGYHSLDESGQALWHVYRDFDDKWAVTGSDEHWQSNEPLTDEMYDHYKSHEAVSTVVSCGNVYSYVCWEANQYTISYDSNGGNGTTQNSYHLYDTYEKLSENGFTKKGCTFMGWSTSKNGNVSYGDQQLVLNLTDQHQKNIQLYAVWSSPIPTLETKIAYYYKDENVSNTEVLKNANAYDEYDGDISHNIIIISYQYPDGHITENPPLLETDNLGLVQVRYSITNSHNERIEKIGYVYIVENGSQIVGNYSSPTIYTRFIRLEECLDGTLPLNTLDDSSIWNQNTYYEILFSSLNRSGDNYLIDYDYINEHSFVNEIKNR